MLRDQVAAGDVPDVAYFTNQNFRLAPPFPAQPKFRLACALIRRVFHPRQPATEKINAL